jgi:hypothetical protein
VRRLSQATPNDRFAEIKRRDRHTHHPVEDALATAAACLTSDARQEQRVRVTGAIFGVLGLRIEP